jgi:microcystin-dependent protein
MYPVGVIYTSTVATNPATLFGFGTWVAFGAGKVLIGVSGTAPYTAGATGGSADAIVVSHSHTINDPSHSHGITVRGSIQSGGNEEPPLDSTGAQGTYNTNVAVTGISINSTGSSGTNANLQPYVVVYMWNRTA